MTTTRTHSCNLCRRDIATLQNGVGIKWEANDKIKMTTPGQAETHICQPCIDALEAAIYEQREIDRERDERSTYIPATDAA